MGELKFSGGGRRPYQAMALRSVGVLLGPEAARLRSRRPLNPFGAGGQLGSTFTLCRRRLAPGLERARPEIAASSSSQFGLNVGFQGPSPGGICASAAATDRSDFGRCGCPRGARALPGCFDRRRAAEILEAAELAWRSFDSAGSWGRLWLA